MNSQCDSNDNIIPWVALGIFLGLLVTAIMGAVIYKNQQFRNAPAATLLVETNSTNFSLPEK